MAEYSPSIPACSLSPVWVIWASPHWVPGSHWVNTPPPPVNVWVHLTECHQWLWGYHQPASHWVNNYHTATNVTVTHWHTTTAAGPTWVTCCPPTPLTHQGHVNYYLVFTLIQQPGLVNLHAACSLKSACLPTGSVITHATFLQVVGRCQQPASCRHQQGLPYQGS